MSNLNRKTQNEDVQLAQNHAGCWYDTSTGKYIPFTEMSPTALKRAYSLSQMKEIQHFKKAGFWGKLADKLEEEANRRGIQTKDLKTKYHKNKRHHKKLMKGEIPDASGKILK